MINDIYSQSYMYIIVFLINVLNTPSLEGRPLHVDDRCKDNMETQKQILNRGGQRSSCVLMFLRII